MSGLFNGKFSNVVQPLNPLNTAIFKFMLVTCSVTARKPWKRQRTRFPARWARYNLRCTSHRGTGVAGVRRGVVWNCFAAFSVW